MRSISTIIASAILFIAAAVAAYIFVSTAMSSLSDLQGAVIVREKAISARLQSIIDIDACSYDNTTSIASFYVTNRGTEPLNASLTKIFVNGILYNSTITFADKIYNDSAWDRYETIKISVPLTPGVYQIRIVSSVGSYDEKIAYITNTSCSLQ